jgi:hypothetical protein
VVDRAAAPSRFAPSERARIDVDPDGALAAITEPARITVVELAAGLGAAEIGADPDAVATEAVWLGAPARLVVLSRYPTSSAVHLLDPRGPRTLAEIRLEVPMRLLAGTGHCALAVGARGAAVLTAGEGHLTPFQFPTRGSPAVAGVATGQFLVALPGAIEEWDPVSRVPKRRLRLPRPAAITALGGTERVVWMTTQAEPARIDVIPLVSRGQPKAHDLPEPIAAVSGHPRSDLLVCVGAETGRVYVVDLDGRQRLRVAGLAGLERADSAGLVLARGATAVAAVRAGRPLAVAALDEGPGALAAAGRGGAGAVARDGARSPDGEGEGGGDRPEAPPRSSTLTEPDFAPAPAGRDPAARGPAGAGAAEERGAPRGREAGGGGPAGVAGREAGDREAGDDASGARPRGEAGGEPARRGAAGGEPAPRATEPSARGVAADAAPESARGGAVPAGSGAAPGVGLGPARGGAAPPGASAARGAGGEPVPGELRAPGAQRAPVPARAAARAAAPPPVPRPGAAAGAPLGFFPVAGGASPARLAAVGAPLVAAAKLGAEAAARWREELVAWARAIAAGIERDVPVAPLLEAVAARFDLTAAERRALALLYGAHLGGEPGAAPVDVARASGPDGWADALGRGALARARVAVYARSRVRLADPIRRALDELPPRWGELRGAPGAPALLAPWGLIAEPGEGSAPEPLGALAARALAQVGGALLVAHPGAHLRHLTVEGRARGAVPLLWDPGGGPVDPSEPAIFVVASEAAADRLGVPIL